MLAFALALIVLDGSIVSVALPSIITDLGLGITDAQWINSLYAVIFSALLLVSGRLGDRHGRATMLLIGVVIFVGSSVWAAAATSGASLIAARFVQGIGGACIMPSTLSTVNATFRGKERAAAFGVWGAVMSGAAALGPLLGGWLTSAFSWRWIFLVNVPLGAIVIVGIVLWVRNTKASDEHGELDVVGALLSGAALALIVFAIIEASTLGWWQQKAPLEIWGATLSGPAGLALTPIILLVGLILLGTFLWWETRRASRGETVLLDLTLFRIPAFAWGNLTAATVAVGEFSLLFVLPLYLVNVRAYDVLHAGFVLAALAFGAFLSGASARHLAGAIGAPATVIVGLALEVLGVITLAATLTATTPLWLVVTVLVVYGIGLGLASAQLTSTVLRDVPTDQSGQGSATQSTIRQVGTALGASIAGALLSAGLAAQASGLSGELARLAQASTDSAGGVLPGLIADDTPGVDQLLAIFSDATRWTILGAGTFLLLGLIGSVVVCKVSRPVR